MTKLLSKIDISRALSIDGWMSEVELRWLAEKAVEHKVIVELGSYYGRSTVALAANTDGVVIALDDWNGVRDTVDNNGNPWFNPQPDALYKTFLRNVRDLPIVPRKCDHAHPPSLDQFPCPVPDMVFIDGSHEYPDVHRDIVYWREKLAHGGLLCGHDYNWIGVQNAVVELLPHAKVVEGTSIWYWVKDRLTICTIAELAQRTGMRLPDETKKPELSTELPPWTHVDVLPKNIAVAIGIASSGRYTPMEWGLALGQLAIPPSTNRVFIAVKGVKRDLAREGIAEKAIECGARNLLFLDDDNPPPMDTIYKLLQTLDSADDDVAVCAGIYCTKTNPPAPLVFKDEGQGSYWRWKRNEVFECERIATGCMMIRTAALAKIPKPWFVDVTSPAQARALGLLDAESQAIHYEMTDDIYFCRKVRAAGFKILAHGGVLPGHWDEHGNVYFLPADSYPMRP